MVRACPVADFLASDLPVVDVRSPGEFARGHIPGATSLPLFTDEQRAIVGTLYKQQGRDAALLEGLRLVGPMLATMVERARAAAPEGRIRVHCWRGGERSGSMAWLLDKAGFSEVLTLRGGYKAFRKQVLDSFTAPLPLVVLGGYTGTGKTELLHHLHALGEQVIDLEGLAHHKGSAFGALGQEAQPTTEHFENLLWQAFRVADRARPIWLEDESLMIGRVRLPDGMFTQLRQAPLLFVDIPQAERAERLVQDYGRFPKEALTESLVRIGKRLGPQHLKAALEALGANDLHTVALIALRYYDKAYLRGAQERPAGSVVALADHAHDLRALALRVQHHASTHFPRIGTGAPHPA